MVYEQWSVFSGYERRITDTGFLISGYKRRNTDIVEQGCHSVGWIHLFMLISMFIFLHISVIVNNIQNTDIMRIRINLVLSFTWTQTILNGLHVITKNL
jgi:hypothetical protein